MKTIYSLTAIGLTLLAATTAQAQLPGSAGRAAGEVGHATRNAADRAGVTVRNEQERLGASADPNAHLGVNADDARLNANTAPNAIVPNTNLPNTNLPNTNLPNTNLPNANVNARVNAGVGAQSNDANRWRYVRHNNQWWYYSPSNTWMYHHNNTWNQYNQATYMNPRYSTGYRGYNNQYNTRRYNYAPRAGVRGNVGVGAGVGVGNGVLPGVGAGVGGSVLGRP